MTHTLTDPGAPGFMIRKSSPPGLWSKGRISQISEVQGARLVFLSGQVAADANYVVHSSEFRDQLEAVFDNLEIALKAVGAGLEHILKTTTFIVDEAHIGALREVRAKRLGHLAAPPCNTLLVVRRLAEPEFLVEVEAIAAVPPG